MTQDEIEALILANLDLQFAQLTAIYQAVDAGNLTAAEAARTALQKLVELYNILQDGLANRINKTKLDAQYNPPITP